jgi:hypothetical protein
MVRIWAKIMKDDKIVKQTIFENSKNFDVDDFFDYVSSVCHTLDLATPVVLLKHVYHFVAFKNAKFVGEDFPEEFPFDSLVIEDATNY